MAETAIELRGVGKQYRLGAHVGGRRNAWQAMTDRFRAAGPSGPTVLDALSDIDLTVDRGETIGLVGRNGSGKSTLLKVIGAVTAPSSGVSRTRGKVGSLLEVGAGFYSELTGRENVFVVGSILGMRQSETRKRFDNVIEFAELDADLVDTPVKWLSSGQYLRLAFSVSAHLDADIMLVDEVLAVGDHAFQQKCLRKMRSLAGEGRSVIFVSHQLQLVQDLCDRTIWIDKGRKTGDGPTDQVLSAYRSHRTGTDTDAVAGLHSTVPTVTDRTGRPKAGFERGESILVRLDVKVDTEAAGGQEDGGPGPAVGCSVLRSGLTISTVADQPLPAGPSSLTITVPGSLGPGNYEVRFHTGSTRNPIGEPALFQVVAAPGEAVAGDVMPGLATMDVEQGGL